jgi:acyl-CoA thioester hydrolase
VESSSGEQETRGASISLKRHIEWIDTDAAGRYHYATALRLIEDAETSLLAQLGIVDIFTRLPRAHLEADFKRMVNFRDTIEVNLEVASVGNSSVSYEFELLHEGELCVGGKLVGVLVDPDGRPTRWPDEHRQLLMPDGA